MGLWMWDYGCGIIDMGLCQRIMGMGKGIWYYIYGIMKMELRIWGNG